MRDLAVLDEAAIEQIRATAMQRVAPLKPRAGSFFEPGGRTDAGRSLPPYFLVYFLLVDLLGFPNLGREEKIAWCIPVEFEGHRFRIQHSKFGVGVFGATDASGEAAAAEVTKRIHRGCKAARPFFEHLAAAAIRSGHINVVNHSVSLYGRYEFLRELLRADSEEFRQLIGKGHPDDWFLQELMASLANQTSLVEESQSDLEQKTRDRGRRIALSQQIAWLHQSVIEAFFSWTEHALVHIAVLKSRVTAGPPLHELTQAEWPRKFATAFDISDEAVKVHYDALIEVRREHRNFTSHGAFGKEGEAFQFHSGAGAVSIRLQNENHIYTVVPESGALSDEEAMAKVDAFVQWLATGLNEPLWKYLQSGLTTVLTLANGGTYRRALASAADMDQFVDYQERLQDDHANMDW